MSETPPPSLRLRIDRTALAANWRTLDRLSGSARAGAAIKADAYGLGVDTVVPILREAGCRDFFVAHWSEVAPVLRNIPATQLRVLHGLLTRADADYALATGVRPVLNSLRQVQLWREAGGTDCDLMVDTGINRLGLTMDDLAEPDIGKLTVHTVHSHLACADEDSPMNARQQALWTDALLYIGKCEGSIANSAGIVLGSAYHGHLTRPGLALYGGVPRGELAEAIAQVAYPQAAIIQRRLLAAGDSVGYNATFTAPRDMAVGVVSLGYADGYLRSRARGGYLSHSGRRLPLLGKISMDMVVVDLAAAPELAEGDWLDVPFALPEAADLSGLSQYELLTVIGRRLCANPD